MIVWGGETSGGGVTLNGDGGRYEPSTDSWTTITNDGAPSGRAGHTAIWTGEEMIVWGGISEGSDGNVDTQSSGGRYDPLAGEWKTMSIDGAPSARTSHVAFWANDEMIVWGGAREGEPPIDGGRYNPATDTWLPVEAADLSPTTAILGSVTWTGSELIVWAWALADSSSLVHEGARYSPTTDSWAPMNQDGAPLVIAGEAVWTGNEMIVAGDNGWSETGGRYDPDTDSWSSMDNDDAPPMTNERSAVWADSLMIVWGGVSFEGDEPEELASGGLYDPVADVWTATATPAIAARSGHTAVWTGDEMIVWGGFDGRLYLSTGGRFVP